MKVVTWPASTSTPADTPGAQEQGPAVLAALLLACARQDQDAFARLYQLISAKLYGLVLRILRHEGEAQECLQEVFLNVWRHAHTFDPAKAAPLTWLSRIARNRALDLCRRRREEVSVGGTEALDALAGETSGIGEPRFRGEGARLAGCLAELNDNQRRSLLLAYYDGLSYPELARRLNVPLGTVKTWLRRGLETLRRCLAR